MAYQAGYVAPDAFKKTKKKGGTEMTYEKETVEEIAEYPCLAIDDRGITQKTAEHFSVRTALSTTDGCTPIAHYFPYTSEDGTITGYKKRDLTKHKKEKGHFTIVGLVKPEVVQLFGTRNGNATGGKKVWICEGEYDSMTSYQVLKDEYPRGNPTVLSIGFGTANAVQHIGQKFNMKFLNKFAEKITVFDNDHATMEEKEKGIKKGKEATADVYGLIPDMFVAPLPDGKDPCDVTKENTAKELYWMLMKPVKYTPEGFVRYEEIRSKAIALPTLGKPWPWPAVTKKTLGRRTGEGIYIGSGVKMGKSVIVDTIVEHIIRNDKNSLGEPQKAALFKFEEQPDETIKKVAGKFYRKDYSNPEKIIFINAEGTEVDIWGDTIVDKENYFTPEQLEVAVDSVGDSIVLYNNYGRCHWDELKGAIRHAVLVEHITDVFIDPITRLTAGMSPSDANTELERFADEVSKMAQDLGFTYYCFCHLKAPNQGASHEFGGKIMSSQFRGSRAMMQACFYMMGLEGNKDPEQPEKVQNTRYLVILDDRKHGRTARIPLFYDVNTGVLAEPPEGFLEDDSCQTLQEWYNLYPNGKTIVEETEDF